MKTPSTNRAQSESNLIFIASCDLSSAVTPEGKISYKGDELDVHRILVDLINFCHLVLHTEETAFLLIQNQPHPKFKEASKLASHFYTLQDFPKLKADDLSFTPDLELFFEAFQTFPLIHEFWFSDPNNKLSIGKREAEVFNEFITWMRQCAIELNTRKKLSDWRRGVQKNAARLKEFTRGQFSRHRRLLVIRDDLLYRKTCLSPVTAGHVIDAHFSRSALGMPVPSIEEVARQYGQVIARVNVREAQADLKAFLKELRRSPLANDLVGYVWCMEWSRPAGYHFHIALFYDGSKRQGHDYLAQEACRLWANVTQGRGFGHNCNRDRQSYRNWGIGLVERGDQIKRKALDQSLSYLVKRSQVVRVKPTNKSRTFQTSMLKPKKPDRPTSRRPAIDNSTTTS